MGCLAAMGAVVLAACAPDAATTNLSGVEDSLPANRALSSQDQAQILQVLSSTAEGHPTRPLVSAPNGYRWSDVPGALSAAASQCSMAVGAFSKSADEVVATLVLPDGQRGTATASRGESGVTVRASIGAFGQPEVEARFARAFVSALKRMGAVRRPQETP
ncbi:MAG: hypothetical protein JNK53_01095 [Phycisphaerae bacterium]|nr:hypothetical protein [Phycisphaerae bacterium]